MLGAMLSAALPDVLASSPTAAWGVPVVVVLVLAGATLIATGLLARPGRGAEPEGWRHFAEDDLPGFADSPPGWAAPALPTAPRPAPPVTSPTVRGGRIAAVAGAVALLAAAAVAAGTAHTAADPRHSAAGSPAADPPAAPLPQVPAAPTAGEPGAGALADTAVPLGRGGVGATLRFGGIVLEPRAVGVTVTYPEVTVSAGSTGAAVAHVRLPTFDCLTTGAPPDPLAAGCVGSQEEEADLPTPALAVAREADGGLRVSGRFPTYTRANGAPPVYTGRVYDLAFTAHPAGPRVDRQSAATGELFLGGGTATTVGGDAVNVLRFGG